MVRPLSWTCIANASHGAEQRQLVVLEDSGVNVEVEIEVEVEGERGEQTGSNGVQRLGPGREQEIKECEVVGRIEKEEGENRWK